MTIKRCTSCGVEKEEEHFPFLITAIGRRQPICHPCKRSYAYKAGRTQRGWTAQAVRSARRRAKIANVPCTITAADLPPIPDVCPALGIPLVIGGAGFNGSSPSLDRIIPSLGYVPGNLVIISFRANRIKNDSTVSELCAVASFYANLSTTGNISLQNP